MYYKDLLTIIYITLVVSVTTTTAAVTGSTGLPPNLPQTFPPLDIPPQPVAAWTALVDKSKLPAAPVNPTGYGCVAGVDTYCSFMCTSCSRKETDITHCPAAKDWGLTYDDGPSENTPKVLDHLKVTGQKGTFFVIGSRIMQNPEILIRTVAEGHQIGVHTWSHTQLTTQSTDTIIAEMKYTETVIKKVVGLTPKLMRPPTGDIDDRVRGIVQQLGYKIVLWNHDTFDWKSAADPTYDLNWIPNNFTIWAQNISSIGVISLEHDLYNTSSSKIPEAIDIIVKYGYTSKQISNCVQDTPAYIENVPLPLPNGLASSSSSSPSPSGKTSPTKSSAEIHVPGFLAIIISLLVVAGSIFIKLD